MTMAMAMRGVVLALLVLRMAPGSHSPTARVEGGLQNCPWAVPACLNSVSQSGISLVSPRLRVREARPLGSPLLRASRMVAGWGDVSTPSR